ncbi:hypothetical protein BH11ACT6_BH11ACT6_07740 [soil metagenome]
MAETFDEVPIEQVAEGDIVDTDGKSAKVVFKAPATAADGSESLVVTYELDDGETFDTEYAIGTVVSRFPESKWESTQSPTGHTESGE